MCRPPYATSSRDGAQEPSGVRLSAQTTVVRPERRPASVLFLDTGIVQNPTVSLDGDVAATQQVLDQQDGPTLLVGHSYGGVVITELGMHDKVAGLVYITALAASESARSRWKRSRSRASRSGRSRYPGG